MVEQAVGEKELLVISHLTFFSCHLERQRLHDQ